MPETHKLRRSIRLLQEDSGSELVEFAIAVPILLAFLFGIMDFSRAMYCYHYVTYAAQDAARYAMLRGSDGGATSCSASTVYNCVTNNSDVQSYVKSQALPLINPKNLTVNATWPGTTPACSSSSGCAACSPTNSPGCLVQVQVTYNFSFMLPFLPQSAGLNLTGKSEQVIQ